MSKRPDYKARAAKAVGLLRRAVEISNKDHRREPDIIWFDFGSMEQAVKMALDALEPTTKAE